MSDDTTPEWIFTIMPCADGEHLHEILTVDESVDVLHCVKCGQVVRDPYGVIRTSWRWTGWED